MHDHLAHQAADEIVRHRLQHIALEPLAAALRPIDVDAGYRLQELVNAKLSAAGLGPCVGHKVGSTNPVIQARLGMPSPMAGRVFASTVHHERANLRLGDYVRLGVECETVLRLGRDLPASGAPYSADAIAAAIDACAPGIEIIDFRYGDLLAVGAPTVIADNGLDAGVIIGTWRTSWRELDLSRIAARTVVNGEEVGAGSGAAVLGNPLNVALWIATCYARLGWDLRAGEFIFTGSMMDIAWLAAGDHVRIEIEGLGAVEANVD